MSGIDKPDIYDNYHKLSVNLLQQLSIFLSLLPIHQSVFRLFLIFFHKDQPGIQDFLSYLSFPGKWNVNLPIVFQQQLIGGLGGEKERWTIAATNLQTIYDNLVGDVLISAGVIAYLGPFTMAFRDQCTKDWVKVCTVSCFMV
jgi:hypothetical protein